MRIWLILLFFSFTLANNIDELYEKGDEFLLYFQPKSKDEIIDENKNSTPNESVDFLSLFPNSNENETHSTLENTPQNTLENVSKDTAENNATVSSSDEISTQNVALEGLEDNATTKGTNENRVLYRLEDMNSSDENFRALHDTNESGDRVLYRYDAMNFEEQKESGVRYKVALLIPNKVIGSYANSVNKAVLAYMSYYNINGNVRFYYSGDESDEAMEGALERIEREGASLIIAPVTKRGARFLSGQASMNRLIYIPTLNSAMMSEAGSNVYFGGIDYKEQIRKLSLVLNDSVHLISDDSSLAMILDDFASDNMRVISRLNLSDNRMSLFGKLEDMPKNSSFFLNLPVQKVAISLAELSKIKPKQIGVTQVAYSDELFRLSNEKARKNLYIANSLGEVPQGLRNSALMQGVNLSYDWIAYSTMAGLDYLYHSFWDKGHKRAFGEPFFGNQLFYESKIYKTTGNKFELYAK